MEEPSRKGNRFFDSGAVTEVKSGQGGWQGMVRGGKRPIRASVAVKPRGDLETSCPCPENQSSGAVCAHAVAVGLAALAAKIAKPRGAGKRRWRGPQQPCRGRFYCLSTGAKALGRGKLAATLAVSSGDGISPADDRLNAWLAREKVVGKEFLSPISTESDLPSFSKPSPITRAWAAGKDRLSITIRSGERFHLDDAVPAGRSG